MKKVTQLVLMLSLILSGAFSYAHGMARTEEKNGKDGIPIILTEGASHGSSEKGNSIVATINGHYLTIAFTVNLGEVTVEINTPTGDYVQSDSCLTPNGLMFYIPNTGDYIITFTLPNGDEYYGEFTVTE